MIARLGSFPAPEQEPKVFRFIDKRPFFSCIADDLALRCQASNWKPREASFRRGLRRYLHFSPLCPESHPFPWFRSSSIPGWLAMNMAGTPSTPAGGNLKEKTARKPVARFAQPADPIRTQAPLPVFEPGNLRRRSSATHCGLDDADWHELNAALRLTNRELEVIKSVFHAQTEAGIAVELGISINTVHTHLGRVYKKLGVQSAAGLILRVFSEFIQHS
jgi:DNA-binding CsgD family transcriptional regulator